MKETIEKQAEREAVEKLAELEAWVKAQPALTPEQIEALKQEANQRPELAELKREIRQGRAILDRLEGKK